MLPSQVSFCDLFVIFKFDKECDIDLILSRAETAQDAPTTQADEVLSAFKVTQFNVDEDKLWDDIIPAQDRIQLHDQEKKELGVRRAKVKVVNNAMSSDDEKDDSSGKFIKSYKATLLNLSR